MRTQKVNGNVYNILQSLQRKKPGSYGYRLAERCLLSEPVVKDNNSWYWCWCKKDVHSVTLPVADKKGGPSQILRRPITKLVHNKNNKMNVILRGARWSVVI